MNECMQERTKLTHQELKKTKKEEEEKEESEETKKRKSLLNTKMHTITTLLLPLSFLDKNLMYAPLLNCLKMPRQKCCRHRLWWRQQKKRGNRRHKFLCHHNHHNYCCCEHVCCDVLGVMEMMMAMHTTVDANRNEQR